MSHPLMFDEKDPYLARVRDICSLLPGADEKVSHGRPNFFTRKVLPPLEALKGDHYSPIARNALLFLPDASERQALLERRPSSCRPTSAPRLAGSELPRRWPGRPGRLGRGRRAGGRVLPPHRAGRARRGADARA